VITQRVRHAIRTVGIVVSYADGGEAGALTLVPFPCLVIHNSRFDAHQEFLLFGSALKGDGQTDVRPSCVARGANRIDCRSQETVLEPTRTQCGRRLGAAWLGNRRRSSGGRRIVLAPLHILDLCSRNGGILAVREATEKLLVHLYAAAVSNRSPVFYLGAQTEVAATWRWRCGNKIEIVQKAVHDQRPLFLFGFLIHPLRVSWKTASMVSPGVLRFFRR